MAYIGRGVHDSERKATSVDAQLMPRLLYICIVNSGKAAATSRVGFNDNVLGTCPFQIDIVQPRYQRGH